MGRAVEGLDYRTYLARSRDGGATWEPEGPLLPDRWADGYTHSVRLSAAAGGLVGFGALHRRDDPAEGIVNHATLGMVPMNLILARSDDDGASWSDPEIIDTPLVGPAFEICHAIVELPDGRWLAPTATWAGWDGERPEGRKTVVLESDDAGRAWPRYAVMFRRHRRGRRALGSVGGPARRPSRAGGELGVPHRRPAPTGRTGTR